MRTKTAGAVLMAAALTGCVGQQTRLTQADRLSLASQPQVHAVHHVLPRAFAVRSTGHRVFMALGTPFIVVPMVAEGMAMQRDLKLQDPAPRVKDRLAGALQANLQLANLRIVPEAVRTDELELLKQLFHTGVVLDVRTSDWGIDNNRAKYSGRARLVRLADAAILWQGTCEAVAGKDQPSPEREALVANEGRLLKRRLLEAADGCAEQLAGWILEKGR
jgi:ABC-type uncharacterized transport system auxiliary subunit